MTSHQTGRALMLAMAERKRPCNITLALAMGVAVVTLVALFGLILGVASETAAVILMWILL